MTNYNFPLFLEEKLVPAIEKRYFDLDSRNTMFKECIRRLAKISWASSPLALRAVIQRVIDTPEGDNTYNFGKLHFLFDQQRRKEYLDPLLQELSNWNLKNDLKLEALCIIIKELKQNSEKIIIFCERRATVVYLVQSLEILIPELKVVATIEKSENEYKYQMKETKEIEKLIKKFAPISNNWSLD